MWSWSVCADILQCSARVLVAVSVRTWSAAPRSVVGVEPGQVTRRQSASRVRRAGDRRHGGAQRLLHADRDDVEHGADAARAGRNARARAVFALITNADGSAGLCHGVVQISSDRITGRAAVTANQSAIRHGQDKSEVGAEAMRRWSTFLR